MVEDELTVLSALNEAHTAEFFHEHSGHDFQPYDTFMWSVEMAEWWQAWTGGMKADGAQFRAFGQDGSGGLAAFWLRQPDERLDHQPIIFLGSEGEFAVIAHDLGDYLWLLANGVGPLETIDGIERTPEPIVGLTQIAQRYTGSGQRSTSEVIAAAQTLLPDLTAMIDACSADGRRHQIRTPPPA
ncbi:SMI1/KNR4 family protein [Dactylosporangium sp. CA-139114]|uniref:SMI1/KNR4 family protein n=1 Tax=Dactylosporangium sp. CA-139114 TaxID=3239931 RepID=UPI003D99A497